MVPLAAVSRFPVVQSWLKDFRLNTTTNKIVKMRYDFFISQK
jgi:hypothetical protein